MIDAAIADLRAYVHAYDVDKAEQKIADLTAEIAKRDSIVTGLEKSRERNLAVAQLFVKSRPDLAFALHNRAGILLEEIERQRPHALTKKLNEALQEKQDVASVRSVLESLTPEILDGLKKSDQ